MMDYLLYIKIYLIVLRVITGIVSIRDYMDIAKVPRKYRMPFWSDIFRGQLMALITCWVGVGLSPWTLCNPARKMEKRNRGYLVAGCIILVEACVLIASLVIRTKYLPLAPAACKHAASYRATDSDSLGFFATLEELDASPDAICGTFVAEFVLEITLIISILLSCALRRRCIIPMILSSPFQLLKRRLEKDKRRPRSHGRLKITEEPKRRDSYIELERRQNVFPGKNQIDHNHSSQYSDSSSEFLKVFTIYPIVDSICENLHPPDLVNLSHTSRKLRDILPTIPKGRPDLPIPGSSQMRCCFCADLRCLQCRPPYNYISSDEAATKTHRHAFSCQPICSGCLLYRAVHEFNGWFEICQCTSRTLHGYKYPEGAAACQPCEEKSYHELKKMRQEEETRIARRQAMQMGCKCHFCQKELQGTGSRFWACEKCRRECDSKLHSRWPGE